MSDRPFSKLDIHLMLDGELPAEEQGQFHAWLDTNPEMKALSDSVAGDMARLREAVAGVIDEPAPERLLSVLPAEPKSAETSWWNWRVAAAAAALFVAGGIGGYFTGTGLPFGQSEEEWLAEQAIGAYATYPTDLPHTETDRAESHRA